MKRLTQTLTLILVCISVLYLAALFMRNIDSNIQLTHMLNLHETETGKTYQNFYTLLLILSSVSALAVSEGQKYKKVFTNVLIFCGSLTVLLTIYPVILSPPNKASFYENYLGEQVTIIVVIVLVILAAYKRKKETITKRSTE